MKATVLLFTILLLFSCNQTSSDKTIISFHLDNNRLLIPGEIKKADGTMKNIVLWVDTGNPFFFISEELAEEIGVKIPPDSLIPDNGKIQIVPPEDMRVGNLKLDFDSVPCYVVIRPKWLFTASHNDVNIPSTVLMKYDIEIDYTNETLVLSNPGTLKFSGAKVPAFVNHETGISQIDGFFRGDSISFAIDIGASYCFGSKKIFEKMESHFPDNGYAIGTAGCANIWGWLSFENQSAIIRVPEVNFGALVLKEFGMVIPPDLNDSGAGMMDYYSQKTFKPVDGFLGPNAFADYKIGIDYVHQAVFFEKKRQTNIHDLDLVPLTLKPELNGTYTITGVPLVKGVQLVDNVIPGDVLVQIDDFKVTSKPMGEVIDALRGVPGDNKRVIIKRNDTIRTLVLQVKRVL